MEIQFTKHANEVIQAITDVSLARYRRTWETYRWTSELKSSLCTLGQSLGYWTCAGGVGNTANTGEWLFDVTWLDYQELENGESFLRSVPLVVESEWGAEIDIIDDFEKLLVAHSELRLMIFGDRNKNNDETATTLYKRAVRCENILGNDQFIMMAFQDYTEPMWCYTFKRNTSLYKKRSGRWDAIVDAFAV